MSCPERQIENLVESVSETLARGAREDSNLTQKELLAACRRGIERAFAKMNDELRKTLCDMGLTEEGADKAVRSKDFTETKGIAFRTSDDDPDDVVIDIGILVAGKRVLGNDVLDINEDLTSEAQAEIRRRVSAGETAGTIDMRPKAATQSA